MQPLDRVTPKWRHRLFVAYVVAMLLLFLTPGPGIGVDWSYIDKAVHFVLFLGFALVLYFDRRTSPGQTFLTSALFAAGVELVQWLLPFRDVDLMDFLAGAAGAALATVILLLYRASIASGSTG